MPICPALQLRLETVDTFGRPADMSQFEELHLQKLMYQAADLIRQDGPDADMAEAVFDAINVELGRRGY
jgi:hypothetical protein